MEPFTERTRLIRKPEAKAAAAVAMRRLSDLIKQQTALLEADVATQFIGRNVFVARTVSNGAATNLLATVTSVALSYTGFRLVGEFIDPVSGMTVETNILIDELLP